MLQRLLSSSLRAPATLTQFPVRNFGHPRWSRAHWREYKPRYFDTKNAFLDESWSPKIKRFRYHTQDPLYFDYKRLYLNSGIMPAIEQMQSNSVPPKVNKRAYLMYHMGKQGIIRPDIFEFFEQDLIIHEHDFVDYRETVKRMTPDIKSKTKELKENYLTPRFINAAVVGYYLTGCGGPHGLEYWERKLILFHKGLHIYELMELVDAFLKNGKMPLSKMHDWMDQYFLDVIVDKWHRECTYHIRRMYEFHLLMDKLEYQHERLLECTFTSLSTKKRIANMTFFEYFHNKMKKNHEEPTSPFFQKLGPNLESFREKHLNVNREWRYNYEQGRMRTIQELIARREESKQDDFIFSKVITDQKMLKKAVDAENKMKRMRMAKYSTELFDDIVLEMMQLKRTTMEMMAELECEDEQIQEAQTRITQRRMKEGLSLVF